MPLPPGNRIMFLAPPLAAAAAAAVSASGVAPLQDESRCQEAQTASSLSPQGLTARVKWGEASTTALLDPAQLRGSCLPTSQPGAFLRVAPDLAYHLNFPASVVQSICSKKLRFGEGLGPEPSANRPLSFLRPSSGGERPLFLETGEAGLEFLRAQDELRALALLYGSHRISGILNPGQGAAAGKGAAAAAQQKLGKGAVHKDPSAGLHQWHRRQSPQHRGVEDTIGTRLGQKKTAGGQEEGLQPGRECEHDTAVVLLGWLGAKQRHLRRYAEWYNSQGMDAITFVIPIGDLISLQPTENALVHVDNLVGELEKWLHDKDDASGVPRGKPKRLLFHTFSNTGWLTYGAVLKRLHEKHGVQGTARMIKGCVVDSAPVLRIDPEIFAAGFSAAILGKRSSSVRLANALQAQEKLQHVEAKHKSHSAVHPERTPSVRGQDEQAKAGSGAAGVANAQPHVALQRVGLGGLQAEASHAVSADDVDALLIRAGEASGGRTEADLGPDGERSAGDLQHMSHLEWTLRAFLTKFFAVALQVPSVRRKLEEVTGVLESQQPPCPQLYIYSTADTVIPARDVEEFMQLQRAAGMEVLARKFKSSPHVDHFRTFPEEYTDEVHIFLEKCHISKDL